MGDLQFLNINPDEEVQGADFSPIPEGEYNLLVEDAESKRTKDGEGQYISLKLQVLDGKYKGRLIFHNVTIQNRNDKAVEIGRKALIILSRCKGKPLTDSAQLLGVTVRAKVRIRPAQNGYDAQNDVAYYIGPIESASQSMPAPAEIKRTVVHRSPDAPPKQEDDDCPF